MKSLFFLIFKIAAFAGMTICMFLGFQNMELSIIQNYDFTVIQEQYGISRNLYIFYQYSMVVLLYGMVIVLAFIAIFKRKFINNLFCLIISGSLLVNQCIAFISMDKSNNRIYYIAAFCIAVVYSVVMILAGSSKKKKKKD